MNESCNNTELYLIEIGNLYSLKGEIQLFIFLKCAGLTEVMSQIEAKTKRGIYEWDLASKYFFVFPPHQQM